MKIPDNIPYEQIVLGALLTNLEAAEATLSQLSEDDFSKIAHKHIFSAYKALSKQYQHVDSQMLATELQGLETGGITYFENLELCAFSGVDIDYYLKELKNLSNLRKLIAITQKATLDACKEEADFENIANDLFREFFALSFSKSTKVKKIKEVLDEFEEEKTFEEQIQWMRDRIDAGQLPYIGISTGYEKLDEVIGFLKPGTLTYCGAQTSVGKTTFTMNIMHNIISKNIPILFFSFEMSPEILSAKLACLAADIGYKDFEDGKMNEEQYERLLAVGEMLRTYPLYIDDAAGKTISGIRLTARRYAQAYDVKAIFIDYLTLINPDKKLNNSHAEITEISKALQHMARELQLPVFCLAQLNRKAGETERPHMGMFRESGSVEQDCDTAILLYREDYKDKQTAKQGEIEVMIEKNRIRGIRKTIKFNKPTSSDRYFELEDIKKVIQKHFS